MSWSPRAVVPGCSAGGCATYGAPGESAPSGSLPLAFLGAGSVDGGVNAGAAPSLLALSVALSGAPHVTQKR
ncbi:hypothetical protein BE08_10585 [Sorangium cellulosum]|uniref:Uncharacterized protein n=1 Tax=Sorangium cellulosum TaxID=56 RepID=A0A150NZE6_SORCE|nr:hypothetical protein BE08_10585 [Sorangium cellulosum]